MESLNRPLRLKHCGHCGCAAAERRRQMTAYHNDESNYSWFCDPCQQYSDEHWAEMWAEYYCGQGHYVTAKDLLN